MCCFFICSICISFYWTDWFYCFIIFTINIVLSSSLVNTFGFLFLNFHCSFNFNLLFFMIFLRFLLTLSESNFFVGYFFQVDLLPDNSYNRQILNFSFHFVAHFFVSFPDFYHYHLLNSYMFLFSKLCLILPSNLFFINPITFLFFHADNSLSNS